MENGEDNSNRPRRWRGRGRGRVRGGRHLNNNTVAASTLAHGSISQTQCTPTQHMHHSDSTG